MTPRPGPLALLASLLALVAPAARGAGVQVSEGVGAGWTGGLRLPPVFVENRGQRAGAERFHVAGRGELGFGEGGFWVRPQGSARRVAFRFVGAAPSAPEALGGARARFHFLRGARPEGWVRDVPAFGGVRYRGLWPGVELVVYARGDEVEYDFRVAPGSDAGRVRLACEGADELVLGEAGELVARLGESVVRQRAPVTTQVDGSGVERELASRFALGSDGTFGFVVEGRDPGAALVIDPVLVYRKSIGGIDADAATGVAVDRRGAVYVAGWSDSDDFPLEGRPADRERGGREACVFKLDAEGSLLWATYLGGTFDDEATAIAVDPAGAAVVVGRTKSSDFPTTPGSWRTTRGGVSDAFAVRLDPSGSSLEYGTFLGGMEDDVATAVALGAQGAAFVVGTTRSRDFPVTSNAFRKELDGPNDAFVVKLDSKGVVAVYSTLLGGTREDRGLGVAVDAEGHAFVTGSTYSLDFPVESKVYDRERGGGSDAFVSKLAFDGGALVWSTFLGGDGDEVGEDVAVHRDGTVSVCGWTESEDFPITGPELGPRGRDGFVTRLSSSGASLAFSRLLGGEGTDACHALALDPDGTVWVCGQTDSPGWAAVRAFQPERGGGQDGFVARLEPTAGEPGILSFLGEAGDEDLRDIAYHAPSGRATTVGESDSLAPSARGLLGRGERAGDGLVAVVSSGACGSSAERKLVGVGCGANLACGPPRVGETLTFRLDGGPPEAEGELLVGPPAEEPTLLGGWCDVHVDLARIDARRPFRTDAAGSAEIRLPIPEDPSLCGARLAVQAVLFAPHHGPLRFGALSQPLLLTLGD